MQRMLEAYLEFARGSAGEATDDTDMRELLDQLRADAERHGHPTNVSFTGEPVVRVRPHSFKRLLTNLVANAQRYGKNIAIDAANAEHFLTIHVDDDGRAFRPRRGTTRSGPSSVLTLRAIRMKAEPASALPLRATLPVRMAATSS